MAEKLEILITADDRASRVMKGLGNIAGGGLKAGMLGAAAGVAALASGLGLAITEAMEAQTVQAQLNAVLKSTGGVAGVTADMANKLADSLTGVTRFSDEAILSGESMLLTFTNIGSEVFPTATQTMLDMSAALGQDLTASAMQLGKALNDPVAGVTALRRVGVQLNDQQEEQIKVMMEAGDVAGAQGIILAELQKEFGGSAEAAGKTFAGQLDILKNSLLNVAEGVGMSLMPILQKLMTDVIQPLLPRIQEFARLFSELVTIVFDKGLTSPEAWEALSAIFGEDLATKIQNVAEWIRKTAIAIGEFIKKVATFVNQHGPLLKDILVGVGLALAAFTVISTVVGWITGLIAVVGGLSAAFAAAGGGIAGVIAILGGPLTLIVGAIALLVAGLALAWKNNWFDIRGKTQAVIDFIKPYIETFLRFIRLLWEQHGDNVLTAVRNAWDAIRLAFSNAFTAIKNLVSTALAGIRLWWSEHGESVKIVLSTLFTAIKLIFTTAFTIIKTVVGTVLGTIRLIWQQHGQAVKDLLGIFWGAIKLLFSNSFRILGAWFAIFANLFRGDWSALGKSLRLMWDLMWTNIKTILSTAVTLIRGSFTMMKGTLATLWSTLTGALAEKWRNLWDTIKAKFDTVRDAIREALTTMKANFQLLWWTFTEYLRNWWAVRWDAIKLKFDTIVGLIQTGFDNFKKYVEGIWDTFTTYLKTIWDTIWGTIETRFNTFKSAFATALQNLIDLVNALIDAINSIPGLPDIPNLPPAGGGGGGGGGCFVSGTLVNTPTGFVEIQNIKVGDPVLSYDETLAEPQFGIVAELFAHIKTEVVCIQTEIGTVKCTWNHRWYTPDGWKEASLLQVGNLVYTYGGYYMPVVSTDIEIGSFQVYNFTVADFHTYFVRGHLVHNRKEQFGGPVYPGRRYLAGESVFTRPEFFIPKQPGFVLTRQNAMQALAERAGGGGNQYNLTIHTNAPYEPIVTDFNILRAWSKG